jgi:predicted unusual protein kinase regulating ubiquinone biosynthesis (AarF/ABC1/UbiB family)
MQAHPHTRTHPHTDFKPVVKEWSTEAIKELDFEHERANMEAVAANLARARIDVRIPACVAHLVTKRIIVMDFMHGFKGTSE